LTWRRGVLLFALLAGASLARAQVAVAPRPRGGDEVERLNAQLLSHDSATAVLQALCDRRGGRGERIRARRAPEPSATPSEDAAARVALGVPPDEPLAHRRVELTCRGLVLSRADNWYRPGRLTPEMNRRLETTDTPFGVAAAALKFHRLTLSAERLDLPGVVLRHRALLLDGAGQPFSYLVETYTDAVLSPGPRARR